MYCRWDKCYYNCTNLKDNNAKIREVKLTSKNFLFILTVIHKTLYKVLLGGDFLSGRKTVLVTGYSKAPQGTSMYELYKHAGIVLEINRDTHTIIGAEFTVVAQLTQNFFKDILIGYSFKDGVEPLIEEIRSCYFAPSQQAFIVAIQAAYQRYWDNVQS